VARESERRPVISCSSVAKRDIQRHYDLATLFYRLLWGRHIHHGLWQAGESSDVAQLHLIDSMARLANIRRGQAVLDVGCGMGGSSCHLARHYGCQVTGVTLSRVQRHWASFSARLEGLGGRTNFRWADAEKVEFPPASFDVLWSVECTEHLFDKPAFFRRAAQWIKPGGRLAICAWLAGDKVDDQSATRQVHDVCEGFLCPSLGTSRDYESWMNEAGFRLDAYHDWTPRVMQTWQICVDRVRQSRVRWLAQAIDRNMVCFLDRFGTILEAYRSGAMRYGCFIGHRDTATANSSPD
jgi:tocopherol O-methyltransferase